jgi:hypothetical protein
MIPLCYSGTSLATWEATMSRTTGLILLCALSACSDQTGPQPGDTSFISAPPGSGGTKGGTAENGPPGTGTPGTVDNTAGGGAPRTVEETDVYRLEGDRLYFLNAYRGLMVFDVSDVDHPRLLGRSPIYGSPVEMIVRNGIATVVVADWYGALEDGTPFHGSVVRGLDATDPAHIKVIGEAKLGGWTTDTRVVGDVLYAVSVDYGWWYGWDVAPAGGGGVATAGGVGSTTTVTGPSVIVSSVSFGGGQIKSVGHLEYDGWGGVFHVTASSVLLAHNAGDARTGTSARTELEYLDISDPGGAIVPRGKITVNGMIQGWGADNGRWNLDFADGKTAHMVGCAGQSYYCDGVSGYVVSTVDFSNPDAPALRSELDLPSPGWSIAARFVADRLYLAPASYDWYNSGWTPFMIVDLADPKAPKMAGTAKVPGGVWNLLPGPDDTMFALGNDWSRGDSGDSITLSYVDVGTASTPKVLGTATFGEGWAWTPAAGTFKAFTMDAEKGLVVLPFSGWSYTTQQYTNGLQLIEFTPTSIHTAGAARTRGWVERGIFVGDRLVSLSDVALAVIDYANTAAPTVVAELTLARNVVAAEPVGTTIATVASDFWEYDVTTSEVRVLPISDAEELRDVGAVPTVTVDGIRAQVFRNGNLTYIVTDVRVDAPCDYGGSGGIGGNPTKCYKRAQQVQVVDLANGVARLRGKLQLPGDSWGWGWGWWGYYAWDWFGGAEVVQVGDHALAFRRWEPFWKDGGMVVDDSTSKLYVVDLSNADAPALASATIIDNANWWWGNLRVVGTNLYVSHYEWLPVVTEGDTKDAGMAGGGVVKTDTTTTQPQVRYYIDRIDLSDLAHPRVKDKINVPGLLIGGDPDDASILYFVDYHWDGSSPTNDIDVAQVEGKVARLISRLPVNGYVGNTIVRGTNAYMSAQTYDPDKGTSHLRLHAIDLGNPAKPVDRASKEQSGWGWLLDVQGDRALVTSGWGQAGIDLYKLVDGAAPKYDQFVRTRGWWTNAITRQGDTLFLASGDWGVQVIKL